MTTIVTVFSFVRVFLLILVVLIIKDLYTDMKGLIIKFNKNENEKD